MSQIDGYILANFNEYNFFFSKNGKTSIKITINFFLFNDFWNQVAKIWPIFFNI